MPKRGPLLVGAFGITLLCASLLDIPVGSVIDPSSIEAVRFEDGRTGFAANPGRLARLLRSDGLEAPQASSLRLFEDGLALGPAHSLHADIQALGKGRYSHWGDAIYFSASDNSDPRTNGRAYRYEDRGRLPAAFLILGALCAGGSLVWAVRHRIAELLRRTTLRARPLLRDPGARARAALASPYRRVASEVGSRAIALLLLLLGIALLFATLVGAPVLGTIDRSSITTMSFADGTTAFVARPSHAPEYIRSDHTGAPDASKLRLFENGSPLGPAHSVHVDIATLGQGRYSHWNGTIFFSASDGSDPRTNRRVYAYEAQMRLPQGFIIPGVLCIAGCLWLLRARVVQVGRRAARHPWLRISVPLAAGASLMLVLVSLSWLFQLLIAARMDVSREDLPVVVAYCLAILVLQGIVLVALPRLAAFLFVALGILNGYSLYFAFSGDLASYPFVVQTVLLLAPGGLYFVLFRFLQHMESWRGTVLAGTAVATILLGAIAIAKPLSQPDPAGDPQLAALGLRVVEFKRRPNVYFLGFDALTPARLADKLLGIGRPPYLDVIDRHGGIVLRNMFADLVPTKPYWSVILSIVGTDDSGDVVVGMKPSLVLETFLRNGYDTHFSYANSYMGERKGPFLTTYAVAERYSTCTFLDGRARIHGLLGYCSLKDSGWFGKPPGRGEAEEGHDDFYLDRLRAAMRASAARPQFFAFHYPWPGHTPQGYGNAPGELAEFRLRYARRSEEAAQLLDKVLAEIRGADPSGIIFVFGDHGAWISRRMHYGQQPDFVVQDRHGILGAVFGAESCMPFLQRPGDRYQTASRLVAGILQCLAGGESPLAKERDFGRISQAPGRLRFEDYLYE